MLGDISSSVNSEGSVLLSHGRFGVPHALFGARQLASVDSECAEGCGQFACPRWRNIGTEDIAIVADEIEEIGEEEEAAVYRRFYTVRQRQDPMEFYTEGKATQKGLLYFGPYTEISCKHRNIVLFF